jgi:beta-N-acetylhexosaminidase
MTQQLNRDGLGRANLIRLRGAHRRTRPGAARADGAGLTLRRRIGLVLVAASITAVVVPSGADGRAHHRGNHPPRLTDYQLIGQHLIYPFEQDAPSADLIARIQRGEVAGVIVRTAQQGAKLRDTLGRLQSLRRPRGLRQPLLILVDEEGGFNTEYRSLYDTAPAELGRIRSDAEITRRIRAMSRKLAASHMNVNLAPVVEVPRPGSYGDKRQRGFSGDPGEVSRISKLWLGAAGQAGIVSTLKHFPGLGPAMMDEDLHANLIDITPEQLRAIDEAPFRQAAHDPRATVMMSTGVYPAFGTLPAMINPSLIRDELRTRLGFQGVVISDDVTALALWPWGSSSQIAAQALHAGSDLVIVSPPSSFVSTEAELRRALHDGALSRAALERDLPRLRALRQRLVR